MDPLESARFWGFRSLRRSLEKARRGPEQASSSDRLSLGYPLRERISDAIGPNLGREPISDSVYAADPSNRAGLAEGAPEARGVGVERPGRAFGLEAPRDRILRSLFRPRHRSSHGLRVPSAPKCSPRSPARLPARWSRAAWFRWGAPKRRSRGFRPRIHIATRRPPQWPRHRGQPSRWPGLRGADGRQESGDGSF